MLNVYDLEKKYRLYKLKIFMPYIVAFVSLCVILIVILFVKSSDMFKSNKAQHNQKTIQTQIEQAKTTPKEEVIKKENVEKNETLILTPSLNFMSNIKDSPNEVRFQRVINKEQRKKSTEQEEIEQEEAKQELEPVIIEEIELDKSHPLKIQRQNTQDDLSLVLERFSKNNNPALSLFIAKKYYEMQNYHQSYNYALITNRINDNIEASWIVFAKSLVKLGRRDEAIKTLKSYFEYSKSTQAKTLLEEIERGKFR
jgi:tetratricopeptide (TPR) repeat protein